MFDNLFKKGAQSDLDRRMAMRRAERNFAKTLRRLDRQRERYLVMGRAAAKNGSKEKVTLIARAIQRCNQFGRTVERSQTALELLKTQDDIAHVKGEFSAAIGSCSTILLDAELPIAVAQLGASMQQVAAEQEEIDALVDVLLEGRPGTLAEEGEAEDLRALEAAMSEAPRRAPTAVEAEEKEDAAAGGGEATARPAASIDDDLKALERELNMT